MLRLFDYLIFLPLLFFAFIALGQIFSGNIFALGIFCVAMVRVSFIIAVKIEQYRNSRRIRRGMAAYLKEAVAGKNN